MLQDGKAANCHTSVTVAGRNDAGGLYCAPKSADDQHMDAAVLTVALGSTFAIALGVSRLVLGLVLSAIVRRD
jgi:hypothetical protein